MLVQSMASMQSPPERVLQASGDQESHYCLLHMTVDCRARRHAADMLTGLISTLKRTAHL
jgi:hypothetical protein